MKIEKVSLFKNKRDFFIFLAILTFTLFYSLLIEYHNYKTLTRFDSNIVDAVVFKQYTKSKTNEKGKIKTYQVLKLKSSQGFSFYTSTKESTPSLVGKRVQLELYMKEMSFYKYFTIFYSSSNIISLQNTLKEKLNSYITSSHNDENSSAIYQALYTATPLPKDLQTSFSQLGVSHLFAISGFHLGVLSALIFFILKVPYKFLQNRYFSYRNSKRDIFIITASILLVYLLFLDTPASLLRAFTMLLIGFILYDRGIKIISMQTLSLSVLILLALFPRLLFELGFWLSVSGVFYIFLFLIHFKHLSKVWQFILIPLWVYLLMLPFSLVIFSSFSLYHPLSIIWTSLFTLFYPLSIFLHIIGFGNLFDSSLKMLISLIESNQVVELDLKWLILSLILSFISIFKKEVVWLLLLFTLSICIHSIYQVTQF